MTRSVAYINPEMLVWARKTVKLPIELAAKKIQVKPEKLESWESGNGFPTIKQLYKIASVYRRPFALFYFPKPPKHFKPLKDFRRFPDDFLLTENDEYALQKELLLFQQKRQIALDLHEQLDLKVPGFVLKGSVSQSPSETSQAIINYLQIDHNHLSNIQPGYEALNYWKSLLEEKGILVFQSSGVQLNIMRGACIASQKLPVIIINSNDSVNGRIFSLFHELVHIVLREDGISNFRFRNRDIYERIEVYCNQTAAEVLVPTKVLEESLTYRNHNPSDFRWTNEELTKLSKRFCVSQEVIVRRLLTLKKTTNRFYQDFRKEQDFISIKTSTGGNYYRNKVAKNGNLFLNLALRGYYQEIITASTFWDYTQVKVSNLPKLEELVYAKL